MKKKYKGFKLKKHKNKKKNNINKKFYIYNCYLIVSL